MIKIGGEEDIKYEIKPSDDCRTEKWERKNDNNLYDIAGIERQRRTSCFL